MSTLVVAVVVVVVDEQMLGGRSRLSDLSGNMRGTFVVVVGVVVAVGVVVVSDALLGAAPVVVEE